MFSKRVKLLEGPELLKNALLVPKVLSTVVEIGSAMDPSASPFHQDLGSVEHHDTEATPEGLSHCAFHLVGERPGHAFEESGLVALLRDAVVEGFTGCK